MERFAKVNELLAEYESLEIPLFMLIKIRHERWVKDMPNLVQSLLATGPTNYLKRI